MGRWVQLDTMKNGSKGRASLFLVSKQILNPSY
jgi:hypothetical protein